MSDELPLVCRVLEGDQPLDTEAQTIGHLALREHDEVVTRNNVYTVHGHDHGALLVKWSGSREAAHTDVPGAALLGLRHIRYALVKPRPVPPPLEVGAGVRFVLDEGDGDNYGTVRYGWIKRVRDRVVDVVTADDWVYVLFRYAVEVVPPDEMPPYTGAPPGIDAKGPPVVVDEFTVNGVLWQYKPARSLPSAPEGWRTSDKHAGSGRITPEQQPWVARALGRGRR